MAAACILILYAAVHIPELSTSEIAEHFHLLVIESAKETYLTSLTYAESDQGMTVSEWIAREAAEMIPLGVYAVEKMTLNTDVEDQETYELILARQANDENAVDEDGNLIGGELTSQETITTSGTSIDTSLEKLSDYEYLLGNFYTVDSSTMADSELLDAQKLLGKDMKIDTSSKGPKVLIYHTHSQEAFADSV